MKLVVSVTPIAVERDSRTYKHAASLARLGFRSLVLEGQPSGVSVDTLPFELITVGGPQPEGAATATAGDEGAGHRERAEPKRPNRVLERLRTVLEPPMALLTYLRWNLRSYRSLPRADLYYLHSYSQYPSVRLRSLGRSRPGFIYDAHDSYFDSGPDHLSGLRAATTQRIFEWIERRCVRRAAGFTTVSDGVAGLLERRYGRRPVVVRNFQDTRLDREASPDLRAAIGAPDEAFVLVMVGQAKSGIALKQALEAMASLPANVRLAFVGANYGPWEAEVKRRGLEGRVHLVAPVPTSQLGSFIRSADAAPVLYLPSTENYRYALPNGFFHAVSAGLPILYPPLVEMAALAEEHRLGLPIDPGSPASIAEGISALADDPELAAELAENVKRAAPALSWEQEEAAIQRLVGSVLGPDGGAAGR